MKTLRRYLAINLVSGWLMVFSVLTALFGLLSLISELERVGDQYSVFNAAFFVGLSLPQQLLELVPVSVLLGTLMALANLDKTNELTIISAAGVRLRSVLAALLIPTLILMVSLWVAAEYVTAPMHQMAETERNTIRGNSKSSKAVWSRDGSRYVHLGRMREKNVPGDIDIYQFDDNGQLESAIHAHHAQVLPDRHWLLKGVKVKQLEEGKMVTRNMAELEVSNLWSQGELPTLALSSESMSLTALYEYSQYLQRTGQHYQAHELSLWKKISLPLATAAMVLLATPLGVRLGGSRDNSVGLRLGIGALIGIFFYLGSQIIFALGLIMNLQAWVTSLIPVVAVSIIALILLLRARW
jgi:lipopolysaccharide export system permease protein